MLLPMENCVGWEYGVRKGRWADFKGVPREQMLHGKVRDEVIWTNCQLGVYYETLTVGLS